MIQSWTDLLGDAHAHLYRSTKDDGSPVHSWDCDHYFYHSQGYAHLMYHMMQALEREYAGQIKDDPVLKTLFDDSIDALGKAAVMKPLIVLNGFIGEFLVLSGAFQARPIYGILAATGVIW